MEFNNPWDVATDSKDRWDKLSAAEKEYVRSKIRYFVEQYSDKNVWLRVVSGGFSGGRFSTEGAFIHDAIKVDITNSVPGLAMVKLSDFLSMIGEEINVYLK